MIFDNIINIKKYKNIPNLDLIVKFIESNKLNELSVGDLEINRKELYVKVLHYFPKKTEENNFETHKIYTDVQFIMEGIEKIQVTNPDNLKTMMEYNERSDSQFFSACENISDIVIKKNEFIVFFPGEAHKPGCFYEKLDKPISKLVFKTK